MRKMEKFSSEKEELAVSSMNTRRKITRLRNKKNKYNIITHFQLEICYISDSHCQLESSQKVSSLITGACDDRTLKK